MNVAHCKRVLLALLVVPLLFPWLAMAQTSEGQSSGGVVVVAQIAVSEAKIVSQKDDTVTVSFKVTNGGANVQTDIKYAVEAYLLTAQDQNGTLADRHVYDEVLALKPGESLTRTVSYAVPPSLDGVYRLRVGSRTSSGLPLGGMTVGNLRFSGSGISINPSSCYLSVGSDEERHPLTAGVDIAYEEPLFLNCFVENAGNEFSVTPSFVTHERTSFGPVVATSEGGEVIIPAGKTLVSIPLPVQEKPQAYDIVTTLFASGVAQTAGVVSHYVVQGLSASIQNVQLDKTSYNAGETASISLFISGIVDQFPDSRAEDKTLSNAFLSISLLDASGESCAEMVRRPLSELEDGDAAFPVVEVMVSRDCTNASVSVSVGDDSGVLDTASVTTQNTPLTENSLVLWGTLLAVVLVGVGVLIVVRKAGGKAVIVLVVIGVSVFSLENIIYASAGGEEDLPSTFFEQGSSLSPTLITTKTCSTGKTLIVDLNGRSVSASVNGVKCSYDPGEKMSIDWSMELSMCSNTVGDGQFYAGVNEIYTLIKSMEKYIATSGRSTDSGVITEYAPSISGDHTFDILLNANIIKSMCLQFCPENVIEKNESLHHIFPFTVVAEETLPTANLSADKTVVSTGDTLNLTWSSANTTSCTATANPSTSSWAGGKSVSGGTQSVGPLSADTTFTITCLGNASNSVTDSVTVFVEPIELPNCSDGVDNDGDGWIDSQDPGCLSGPGGEYNPSDVSESNSPTSYACSDRIDNDGDGLIDADDPGCSAWNDNDETHVVTPSGGNPSGGGIPQCSDGIDNDGDGYIDSDDGGCYTASGIYDPSRNSEVSLTTYQCSDSIDNDGDGLIDMADPGCKSPVDNNESNIGNIDFSEF